MTTIPLWIDNAPVTSGKKFPVTLASSGKVVHEAYGATPEIAKRAVESCQKAFETWSRTTPWHRRELLFKAAALIRERKTEIIKIIQEETPASDFFASVFGCDMTAMFCEELGSQVTSNTHGMIPHTLGEDTMALVIKEPQGVQLGIAPWNASFLLAARAVLTPIAVGNTAVLKASELSPKIHNYLALILKEAGFPAGVLNVMQHSREDGPAILDVLIKHPAVRKVNFTGSTAVGRIIATKAAEVGKPTLMELGGKAPQIVMEDADLDKAAQAATMGALVHHGQICMATERVIVHESVADAFVAKMVESARSFPAGHAVTEAGAKKTQALVQDAVDKGATLALGPLERDGAALKPTIITGLTPKMEFYKIESFGPTAGVLTYKTIDEAVELANDTEYGLSASVFSRNIPKAIAVAKRIQSGAVHINSMTVHDEPGLPHGGMKASGYGRFGSSFGIQEFLEVKTITITDDEFKN